jgi:hypothetical protein
MVVLENFPVRKAAPLEASRAMALARLLPLPPKLTGTKLCTTGSSTINSNSDIVLLPVVDAPDAIDAHATFGAPRNRRTTRPMP